MTITSQAASFDCAKATTEIEKMICADPKLSKLDGEMAEAYQNVLQNLSQAEATKSAQDVWLTYRNRCKNSRCLLLEYLGRIGDLKKPEKPVGTNFELKLQPNYEWKLETCMEPKIDWRNYQWILITGNGKTACEEMLAYLKSLPKDQPPPVCAEDRLPPNGNWTRPEWKEVTPELKEQFLENMPADRYDDYKLSMEWNNLMTARTDISGDGIPENLLAISDYVAVSDWIKRCRISPYCASQDDFAKGEIRLEGELIYRLLPLNDDGTAIDWKHRALPKFPGLSWRGLVLGSGDLIHYKKRPYMLSGIDWSQGTHDNFKRTSCNPNDANNHIFTLAPLLYKTAENSIRPGHKSEQFANTVEIYEDQFATCDFGYFHRNNLKLHPPTTRR